MLKQRKRRGFSCLTKLFGVIICVVVIGWCFFLFGHHILCNFHVGLCTPLVYWYRRMPLHYNKLDIQIDSNSIDIEWNKANNNLTCSLPSDLTHNLALVDLKSTETDHDPTYLPLPLEKQNELKTQYQTIMHKQNNIKRLIVIGIPHGGTTWFATKVLNKHPSIHMSNELLFGWTTSYCNAHFMFNDNTRCNWNTMQSIMETFYIEKTIQLKYKYHNKRNNENDNFYIGFKITLWQLMPTMYGDFVRWIYCNNVTIIQLIRSASINSFYSQQAMVFENLFYGREFFKTQYSKKNAINNETFDLDGKYVKRFVESTEFWQNTLTKLLKFHTKSINILILYYEDIINEYGINYLNSMQGFLGVEYDENVFKTQNYRIARLHSMPCHRKIKNWYDAIKYKLINTDSYYACEKDNS
eukprot:460040_1